MVNIPKDLPPDSGNLSQQVESDDTVVSAQKSGSITRRVFHRVVAILGIGALVDGISNGKLSGMIFNENDEKSDLREDSAEEAARLEEAAGKIAADLEGQMEGLNDREKALKIVDYLGTVVFVWGIKDLMPDLFKSGHGHIHAAHYGAMMALTALKAQLSDEEGRHHLKEEWISTVSAFGIISGTIMVAEGLNMDLLNAYQEAAKKAPSREDRIALMNMFASVLSPVATTVGSASVIRDISNDFADGDPKLMAACVSHVSNLSGYLLFGDPPFLAICAKYGPAEGIKWQLKTMWPLALYSLFSSTLKLNYFMVLKDGMNKKEAFQTALKSTVSSLVRNIPFLAKIVAQSLANVGRYFTGRNQNVGGLQVNIGEILTQKLTNLAKLPFSAEFDTHQAGGMLTDVPEVRVGNDVIETILKELSLGGDEKACVGEDPCSGEDVHSGENVHSDLRKAIDKGDFDEVRRLGEVLRIPNMEIFIKVLQDLHDNAQVDQSTEPSHTPVSLLGHLNPVRIYDKITDVNRIKAAIGHNLGDVVDVFPFQAGCVPFLTTAFKDAVSAMEAAGFSEAEREIFTFFAIMIFSAFADNYVACKIGLELLPEKPQIPLIASIQGGSLTAIGNMANIAQFDLETFKLRDSFAQFCLHLDNIAVGLLWSRALDWGRKIGLVNVPAAVNQKPEAHAKADIPIRPEADMPVQNGIEITRRGFLSSMFAEKKAV